MARTRLNLDYEAMEDSAQSLITEGNNFEDCIDNMTTEIGNLDNIWEADTREKYQQRYEEALPTLKDVRQMIQDMAEQMQKIAQNFRDADESMRDQM